MLEHLWECLDAPRCPWGPARRSRCRCLDSWTSGRGWELAEVMIRVSLHCFLKRSQIGGLSFAIRKVANDNLPRDTREALAFNAPSDSDFDRTSMLTNELLRTPPGFSSRQSTMSESLPYLEWSNPLGTRRIASARCLSKVSLQDNLRYHKSNHLNNLLDNREVFQKFIGVACCPIILVTHDYKIYTQLSNSDRLELIK